MDITPISPLSSILILHGVPLTSSTGDVMSHANKSTQLAYFRSFLKYTCADAKVVRNNVLRLPYVYDDLVDCNYIVYQNANFGQKWFYAFISSMTYINMECTEVEIEIDEWETWQFDLKIKGAYVQRHHVTDDVFGRYLQPESFDTSQVKYILKARTDFGLPYIGIWYVPEGQYLPAKIGRIPQMCYYATVPIDEFDNYFSENIQPLIDVGLSDNVIGAVVIPGFAGRKPPDDNGLVWDYKYLKTSFFMNVDGYVPVNKKLLTFPYNSVQVASQNGLQAEVRLEFFDTDTMTFKYMAAPSIDLMVYGVFEGYLEDKSSFNGLHHFNVPYASVSSGFPQPLFSGLQSLGFAQSIASQAMSATSGLRNITGQFWDWLKTPQAEVMAGVAGKKAGLARIAGNVLGNLQDSIEADVARQGTGDYVITSSLPSSSTSWAAFEEGNFVFLHKCIPAEYAQLYDRYLTRWGYSIGRWMMPNITGRTNFNFVKTGQIILGGNMPQSSMDKIEAMFNAGLTIWHQENGHAVGDWNGEAGGNPVGGG